MPINGIKKINDKKIEHSLKTNDSLKIKKLIKLTDSLVKKIKDGNDLSEHLMEQNSHYRLIVENWEDLRDAQSVEEIYAILKRGLDKLDPTPKNKEFIVKINEFVEENNKFKNAPKIKFQIYTKLISYLMNVIHAGEGNKVYNPSKGRDSKPVKDSSSDVFYDLVERACDNIREGTEDISDAVAQALDDGLIYSSDIFELADGYVDPNDLLNMFYEELFEDVYREVDSKYEDILEEMKTLADKVKEVLDDYGILYGDVVDNDDQVNIVGVDEEEWEEVVDALKGEIASIDIIVPPADHEEFDDEIVVIEK